MAVAVGFEPTDLSVNGFQDRSLKPLGHTTIWSTWRDSNPQPSDYKTEALPVERTDACF